MGVRNFLHKIGETIESSDLFSAPILLRYKTEEHKTSKTGGCFSIALMIVMIVVFYNSWISVFNKTDLRAYQ